MLEVLPELGFGAILPGAAPGLLAVTSGAPAAPFGAGDETPLLGVALDAVGVGVYEPELAGAMLPGEVVDGATGGDDMAPVGAGDEVVVFCAQARPVVISKAVEASQIVRMIVS